MCRGGTNACAHYLDFKYKFFGDVFSIVKKWPLFVIFNIPHCGKYFIPQCSTLLVDMRFRDMYVTHQGTRIKCCTIHVYGKKLFF
jgi:hypothetical protein